MKTNSGRGLLDGQAAAGAAAAKSEAVAAAQPAVRLERACLADAGERFLTDWRTYEAKSRPDAPNQDPQWLRGYFADELSNITVYLFYDRAGAVCGSASFLLKNWPLRLYLGEVPVAELPLKRLRLLGLSLADPDDASAYDLLLREVRNTPGYDAIFFSQTSMESALWKHLSTSELVRREFRRYRATPSTPHLTLLFGASFDEYLKSNFSSTHRYTLRRKVTRFQEQSGGTMRLVRYTRPEEVGPFLEAAVEVSKKTYQWNLHQRGLRATERFERRYRFAAEHGWFRSYLLFRGDTACAFLSGYQWKGRYDIDELGFDPAFTKQSPGTVLHMLAIQDMFEHDKPERIDFGSYDKYKEEFSTGSYPQCDIMLLRRTAYTAFVTAADYAFRTVTSAAVRVLGALNLKSRLKKIIRRRSVTEKQASGSPGDGQG